MICADCLGMKRRKFSTHEILEDPSAKCRIRRVGATIDRNMKCRLAGNKCVAGVNGSVGNLQVVQSRAVLTLKVTQATAFTFAIESKVDTGNRTITHDGYVSHLISTDNHCLPRAQPNVAFAGSVFKRHVQTVDTY